jgi:hypothetical protein
MMDLKDFPEKVQNKAFGFSAPIWWVPRPRRAFTGTENEGAFSFFSCHHF